MTRKIPKLGALRLALLGAVVLGLTVVPASAQADPVRASNCTAQVTATPGEDSATFTIVCQGQQVHTAEFTTSENAVIPGFQGEEPGHGLTCLPPLGNQFGCGSGPGPGLDPGETGTAQVETMDPCGANFAIEDLTLDTGPGPNMQEGVPPEQDVQFQDVRVQCGEEPPPDGDGGGGGGDFRDTRDRANEDFCVRFFSDDSRSQRDIEQSGSHDSGTQSDAEISQRSDDFNDRRRFEEECVDFRPAGGVDAGFGGNAKSSEVPRTSVLPSILGGSALLLFGLTTGGLALLRRR